MRNSVLLLVVASLSLSGCEQPKSGERVLIYGRANDAVTLDPADCEDGESVKVINNVFDTLVYWADGSVEIEPALAESWTTSEDGKTWTFQLRQGVQFHDGTPFDADAVVFTFERLIVPDHPYLAGAALPYRVDYSIIESVTATSPHEVVFQLHRPSGVFLRTIAMFPASIVSPSAVKKYGDQFRTHPVGTGAFVFEEWIGDERLRIVANPDYWRGRPKVDAVVFKPILEPVARLRQLRTGEIDMADELSIPVRKSIADKPGLYLETSPGLNVAYFAMNVEHPPFDDARVRRAVAHAIDKEAIQRSAYEGEGQLATTIVPKAMWGHNSEIVDYPYDPSKARELLKEAGVAPGTEIKFFSMRNGRPYLPSPDQVTAIITQQLREVGFEPVVLSPDWQQFLEQSGQGEHDCGVFGWNTDNGDPDNFLYALLDKDKAIPPQAQNRSFYKSEEVHKLLIEAQSETNQAKRLPLYYRAQELIHADCPIVPLMHLDFAVALRENVTGYKQHPTGLVMLWNVEIE